MVGIYKYRGKVVSETFFKKKVFGSDSKAFKQAVKKSRSRSPVIFGVTKGTYIITQKDGSKQFFRDKQLVRTESSPSSRSSSRPKPVIAKPIKQLPTSSRFFGSSVPQTKQKQILSQRMSRRDQETNFLTRTVAKPTSFKPLPTSSRTQTPSNFLNRPKTSKKAKFKSINIQGLSFTPKNQNQNKFYKNLKDVSKRDTRLKNQVEQVNNYLRLNINDKDKWYSKALKGVGQLGTGIAFTPKTLANVLDKAVIQIKGVTSKDALVRKTTRQAMGLDAKAVPKVVAGSFDPRKPENWASIVATICGVKGTIKGIRVAQLKTTKGFVPSVRNAGTLKTALKSRKVQITVARKLAKASIKAKDNIRLNTKLLGKLDKLDIQIGKSIKQVNKIIKDPKTLKLVDMNPLIKTKDLLKNIGKDKHVFHATAASPSKLFGQKISTIKSATDILKSVKKASGKAKRSIAPKGLIEKDIVKFIKKNDGVIGGGKAQNLFVKKRLTRATGDYDVLIKGGSQKMTDLVKLLKKNHPNNKFQKITRKIKGSNDKVYRLKVDGKLLVDFDPLKSGLKGVKLKTKTVKGIKVVDPELLALKKLESITNLKKGHRFTKDIKDLKRLSGTLIDDSKIMSKVKNPKKVMEVITQRQGMGKSRIKFGETQLFFDFEVPTGYAYQSLTKNVIPKFIRSSAEKWLVPKDIRKLQIFKSKGVKLTKTNNLKLNTFLEKFEPSFKNTFLKKLNSLKYIEGNAKFTVLKLKADVKKFPSQLQNRVKLASKGKLSIKESNKLRTDLNNYINKNPGKLNIGSRTGSKILGEREAVAPVKTKLFKRSKKTSIDPETKIFINVIETSLKKSKIKVPKTFKARLKALTTDKFSRIKKNFSKGDLIKVKKFQKQLKLSDKLTSGQYLDLIEITKKMLLSKKGMVAKKIKRTSKGLRVRRTTPFVRRSSVKSKTTDVSASLTRSKAQSKTKPRTTTKEGKIKRRKVTARVSKPRTIKSIRTRTEPRVRSPLPRVITRPKPRSPKPRKGNRPRPKPRPPKPRPDPRPRDPVPRPRPRPPKPRPRTPLPRPRPRVRVPRRRVPVKIPIRFKVREKSKKWEKDVIEWISKQKKVYRPSLAAVLFNITSYKVPKSITGFEIRPILIKKPKISKRKK